VSRARLVASGFSAIGFPVILRGNVASIAGLIFGTTIVYMVARHAGPLAAALASAIWTALVGLAARKQAEALAIAMGEQAMLARVDDLTGLANVRSFREELRHLESARTGLTLALIDVDQFKAYNDAFGHPAGDAALTQIGKILAGVAVGATRVYRVGGDEFAVIFPNAEGPGPVETVESIRRGVADHPWALRPITVSIGLASFEENERSRVFELADQWLYQAKREGGNRLVAQGFEGLPPV
jgi:diguanylate cyclase (GGDEF)-like protein